MKYELQHSSVVVHENVLVMLCILGNYTAVPSTVAHNVGMVYGINHGISEAERYAHRSCAAACLKETR